MILIFITAVLFFWELSCLFGFGGICWQNDIDLHNYTLNPIDNSIINNYDTAEPTIFVTDLPKRLSLFFSHYIQDVGLVFRFTKLSKKIDNKFKELRNANINA